MCHLIFFLPVAGLPLFWLLPLGYTLPINGGLWLASAFLYRVIRRAMREPIRDGFQSLVGTEAEVVSRLTSDGSTKYLVRAHGELWSAYSQDVLDIGEWVNIVVLKGIGVVVERVENNNDLGKEDNAKTWLSGARDNSQHCH